MSACFFVLARLAVTAVPNQYKSDKDVVYLSKIRSWCWPAGRCQKQIGTCYAVTNMPRSGYEYGRRKVYESPGGQWLSDSDTDDVFLVS
jgi:hypothetical protein